MKAAQGLLVALAAFATAHPGHVEPESELLYKRAFNAQTKRGLAKCADHLEKRGITSRAAERRAAKAEQYKKERMVVRDTDTVANTSHLGNATFNPATPDETVFGSANTCVLSPEGETGPYWVKGEYIRNDLREGQAGVPIVLEGQFLDVETCEPLTNIWWDLWNCNATGVYSGIVADGNGDSTDETNLDNTFLRGIQKADDDGVVTFQTIFPGHYSGRATHHHMIAHLNPTLNPNNTLSNGTSVHVGQLFWDQDLISAVEATYPYTTNDIDITTNLEDRIFATETTDTTSDPVIEYVRLGDSVSDGLFGWITIAVNTSATYDPAYAAVWTSEGGVAESGGGDATDGGNGGGNDTGMGTPPSGSGVPSGSPGRA